MNCMNIVTVFLSLVSIYFIELEGLYAHIALSSLRCEWSRSVYASHLVFVRVCGVCVCVIYQIAIYRIVNKLICIYNKTQQIKQ